MNVKKSYLAGDFLTGIYDVSRFILCVLKKMFRPPYEWREVIRQCYEVGCKALPLLSLTGFLTGIVFTEQSRPFLAEFGARSWLPSLVTVSLPGRGNQY